MDPELLAAMRSYGQPEPEPTVDPAEVDDFFALVDELAGEDEGLEPLGPEDIIAEVGRLQEAIGRELFADEYEKLWVDAQHQYETSGEVDVEAAFVQASKMRGKDPFDERGVLRDPEAYEPGDRVARRERFVERMRDAQRPTVEQFEADANSRLEAVDPENYDLDDPRQRREWRQAKLAEGFREDGYK